MPLASFVGSIRRLEFARGHGSISKSDQTNTTKEKQQQQQQQRRKKKQPTVPRELTHHPPTVLPGLQAGTHQSSPGSHPPRPSLNVRQRVYEQIEEDDDGPLLGMFSSSNKHTPWNPQHKHPLGSVLNQNQAGPGNLKRRVTDTLPSKEARDRAARRFNSGENPQPSTAQEPSSAKKVSTARPSTSNGFSIRRKSVPSRKDSLSPEQRLADASPDKHADLSRKPLPSLLPKISINQNGLHEKVNIPGILGAPDGGYSQKYAGEYSRFMEKFAALMLKEAKEFDKKGSRKGR